VAVTITNHDALDHDFTIEELDVQILMGANETVEAAFEAGPRHVPTLALCVRALRRGEPQGEAPGIEVPPHIEITGMPNPE